MPNFISSPTRVTEILNLSIEENIQSYDVTDILNPLITFEDVTYGYNDETIVLDTINVQFNQGIYMYFIYKVYLIKGV